MSDNSSSVVGPYRVLNVGSGAPVRQKLHTIFHTPDWQEVRMDIDPAVQPDLLGDMIDMRDIVADESFDAVWSSHNIEHLYDHQVPRALAEFRRILKPHGFAIINCPDMFSIARQILEHGLEDAAYISPAGPISPLDMLFGFGKAIANGNTFMAHRTGFSVERLRRLLDAAGFTESWVARGNGFDLWAVALMDATDSDDLRRHLEQTGLQFPK